MFICWEKYYCPQISSAALFHIQGLSNMGGSPKKNPNKTKKQWKITKFRYSIWQQGPLMSPEYLYSFFSSFKSVFANEICSATVTFLLFDSHVHEELSYCLFFSLRSDAAFVKHWLSALSSNLWLFLQHMTCFHWKKACHFVNKIQIFKERNWNLSSNCLHSYKLMMLGW